MQPELETALHRLLPADLHAVIPLLASSLTKLFTGPVPAQAAQFDLGMPAEVVPALRALAGHDLKVASSIISFGTDSQTGDITIQGDLAGHDVIKLSVGTFIGQQTNYYTIPSAPPSAQDPSLTDQPRAVAPIEPEFKLMTLLCVKVSGFGTLRRRLGAEAISDIIDKLWERLNEVVVDYSGHTITSTGTTLSALWGFETTQENDPERAVRAAFALQGAAEEFRREQALNIAIAIAIHTDVMLLESGDDHEFTVKEPVASELMNQAQEGNILISQDTYRHIIGLFVVQLLPPPAVEGGVERPQSYLVVSAETEGARSARSFEGITTKTIGRGEYLIALHNRYREAAEGRETTLVMLTGEPGMGKTRILHDFWEEMSNVQPLTMLRGHAILETLHRAGGLLRNILSLRCEVRETDSIETVRTKLTERLRPFLDSGQVAILGQVAGFDFADVPTVQAALKRPDFTMMASECFAIYLRGLTDLSPTILLLEDLHWADDGSLDLLDLAMQRLIDRRLLVLSTARPVFAERRPNWGSGQPYRLSSIALERLSDLDSRELIRQILQPAREIPPAFYPKIVDLAEGNPFFIEEIIKMLIEKAVIERDSGDNTQWLIREAPLDDVQVPLTLWGVLQVRLYNLPAKERAALRRASVIGRVFWDTAIAELDDDQRIADIAPLSHLQERRLIIRREHSQLPDTQEYSFQHALLREVTYNSMRKRRRSEYHKRAAQWLERAAKARLEERADRIADHYGLADDWPAEAQWQVRAGAHAAAQHANDEAIRRLHRALDLLADHADEALRVRALFELGQVVDRIGKWAEASEHYDDALGHALAISDSGMELHCLLALGDLRRRQSKHGLAQEWLGEARKRAHDLGEVVSEAEALTKLGEVFRAQSDFASAAQMYEECLRLLQPDDSNAASRAVLASNHKALGTLAAQQDNLEIARKHYLESEALLRALDDRPGLAAVLNNLGTVAMHQEDYESAKRLFTEGLHLFNTISDPYAISALLNNLGLIARYQGNAEESQRYFEDAINLGRKLGDRWGVASSLSGLTNMLLYFGITKGVRPLLVESLTINHELEDRVAIAYCLEDFAGLAASLGSSERALHLAGAAAALRAQIGSRLHPREQADFDKLLQPARAALADPDAELRAGAQLDLDAAVALALAK